MASSLVQTDPSMVGAARYARSDLDFYPTPARCTNAFMEAFGDDVGSMVVWEPFCGNGAIAKIVGPEARDILCTDITTYEGFDPDLLVDFFSITTPVKRWTGLTFDGTSPTLAEIAERLDKPTPDAIITNPPYGKLALKAIEKSLELMEPENGFVAMLLRKEYDSAKKHRHVFRDHPAFCAKVDLLFRPRWIEGSTGAPRHNYSWFVWDFSKAKAAPGLRPELFYVG